MTASNTSPQIAFPLQLGQPKEFARVARLLHEAHFEWRTICRILGIDENGVASLGEISDLRRATPRVVAESATQAVLIRLFLLLETLPRAEVEGVIDATALDALQALDLLRPGSFAEVRDGAEVYYAAAILYPVAGMFIASDRHESPDGSASTPPSDFVFPAIYHGTLRFLRVMSRGRVGDALELCAGTGIAALVLSRHAKRVVAADITARSVHFARFNGRLNGCENVEFAQGDLYEAVADSTFDRIVAHPPYVPTFVQSQVFRDAGETGETVFQRIVAGLPRHLRPGGSFYAVTAGWDSSTEGPFEKRIRRWLGEAERGFDLIVAQEWGLSPEQVARSVSDEPTGLDLDVRERFEGRFAGAGLERSVYGAVALERRAVVPDQGEPVTERPRMSRLTDGSAFEWAFRWHRWRAARQAAGVFEEALLRAGLHLAPGLRVKDFHVVKEGELVQGDVVLEARRPFLAGTTIEPWMLPLAADFGAGRTAGEVFERARAAGALPEGFGTRDFVALVAAMVERGYLEIDEEVLGAG